MKTYNVKDKLPDKQDCYLVWTPRSFPKNSKWIVAEFYTDIKTFYSESSDEPIYDVTHWTFLPLSPEN